MIHSNEFDYCSNPYFNTKKDENRLYKLLEEFHANIKRLGIKSCTFNKINK